jgi:methylenetetrahydrofolate dehydrogenase (NADP+) / methenyltetrahydrofolate cyclohydrolase
LSAQLIDGAVLARSVYDELRQRVGVLSRRGVRPGLAAVLVGDDPASEVYVRTKTRACEEVGLTSQLHRFGANCAESEIASLINQLNADTAIHGVLVQLPLPRHLDVDSIMQMVRPEKDVDGFNWRNLGAMVAGRVLFAPCTPLGVMTMLARERVEIEGRNAVVIGRSITVGKPIALMLIAQGATVTVCHSKTRDLREHTARADILVVAVGKPGTVNGSMLKPGAVVIDVGINRLPNGKLTGDVDFASACQVASRITPVPGGVGRMTVAMLLANTVTAAERIAASTI